MRETSFNVVIRHVMPLLGAVALYACDSSSNGNGTQSSLQNPDLIVDPIPNLAGNVSCPVDVINVQAVLDDAFQGQGYYADPWLTQPYNCIIGTYNETGTITRVIEFANCSDPAVSQACLNNGGETGPYYSVETENYCYIEGPDTGIEANTACIDQTTGLPQYKSFSRAAISLEELEQCAINFGCDVDFTSSGQ